MAAVNVNSLVSPNFRMGCGVDEIVPRTFQEETLPNEFEDLYQIVQMVPENEETEDEEPPPNEFEDLCQIVQILPEDSEVEKALGPDGNPPRRAFWIKQALDKVERAYDIAKKLIFEGCDEYATRIVNRKLGKIVAMGGLAPSTLGAITTLADDSLKATAIVYLVDLSREEPRGFLEELQKEILPAINNEALRENIGRYIENAAQYRPTQDLDPDSSRVANTFLEDNLEAAKKIVKYVTNKIRYSGNKFDRPTTIEHVEKGLRQGVRPLSLREICDQVISLQQHQIIKNLFYTARGINGVAKRAEEMGVGNCEEMTKVGCRYVNLQAEIFCIRNGNHVFLVLGRELSDPSDFRNWGPNAVICDSWAEKVYSASQLLEKLEAYNDETISTYPFDETVHSLELLYTPPLPVIEENVPFPSVEEPLIT